MKKHPVRGNTLRGMCNAVRDLLVPPRCIGCDELIQPFEKTPEVFCPLCRTAWETDMAESRCQAAADGERGLVYLTHYRPDRANGVSEKLTFMSVPAYLWEFPTILSMTCSMRSLSM